MDEKNPTTDASTRDEDADRRRLRPHGRVLIPARIHRRRAFGIPDSPSPPAYEETADRSASVDGKNCVLAWAAFTLF